MRARFADKRIFTRSRAPPSPHPGKLPILLAFVLMRVGMVEDGRRGPPKAPVLAPQAKRRLFRSSTLRFRLLPAHKLLRTPHLGLENCRKLLKSVPVAAFGAITVTLLHSEKMPPSLRVKQDPRTATPPRR